MCSTLQIKPPSPIRVSRHFSTLRPPEHREINNLPALHAPEPRLYAPELSKSGLRPPIESGRATSPTSGLAKTGCTGSHSRAVDNRNGCKCRHSGQVKTVRSSTEHASVSQPEGVPKPRRVSTLLQQCPCNGDLCRNCALISCDGMNVVLYAKAFEMKNVALSVCIRNDDLGGAKRASF